MSITLRDAFSVTRFSFWAGVMLSTLVGGVLYVVTTRSIESDVQERFSRHAKYAQAVINMRIKSYTDLLHGAASLLQSGETISHRQFHDYVQGLDLARNYPAVDTLNFATWVREDERPQFERLEVQIGRLLVTGVTISALLLAIGLGLWLFDPGRWNALWLLNAGLIVLMSTPILRVIVSFTEYVAMRQWFFAGVTIVVLLELSVTVVVALSKGNR